MAQSFDGSSNQHFDTASTPVTGPPHTAFAWFYPTAVNARTSINIRDSANANNNRFTMVSTSASKLRWDARDTVSQVAISGNAITLNVWNSGAGISTSTTDRAIVLNGDWANRGTSTVSAAPASIDEIEIGIRANALWDFAGRIAEVAIWDVALVQAQVEALSLYRLSPLLVEPSRLVEYWSLISPRYNQEPYRFDPVRYPNLRKTTITARNSPSYGQHVPDIIYPDDFAHQYGLIRKVPSLLQIGVGVQGG